MTLLENVQKMMKSGNATNTEDLLQLNKKQLVDLILILKNENTALKLYHDFMKITDNKIESLERRININEQYDRRESIEISGISDKVKDEELEDQVLKIYEIADAKVHGKSLTKLDIAACHRIGKKGKTIVRFVNRKFAKNIFFVGKKIRNDQNFKKIYINNSISKEFGKFNYHIRQAYKGICRYKVKNGINLVQVEDNGPLLEITHPSDLKNVLGLDINEE